jgi:hypothetical protein
MAASSKKVNKGIKFKKQQKTTKIQQTKAKAEGCYQE